MAQALLHVCTTCWLVQTEDYTEAAALFSPDYAYFSSVSASWLDHAARYATQIRKRLELGPDSQVVEIASNDGYLLRNFVLAGIPCLGIEPTDSTAAAAEAIGVPTLRRFFGAELGTELAATGRAADLVVGNNVYAHVPDINDFTRGIAAILKPQGVVTLEFPHLLQLIRQCQFDTVYHEHFSYLSLYTVQRIFAQAGLKIFDVEELYTHGGSLRVYGCLSDARYVSTESPARIVQEEAQAGLLRPGTYQEFQARTNAVKNDLLTFLLETSRKGQSVAAYGAAAKGNTMLNFAGVKPDLLPFVYDAAPSKQGRYLPGSHIPILPPAALRKMHPDYLLILPWNIAAEVIAQMSDLAIKGTRFVTAVPELRVI